MRKIKNLPQSSFLKLFFAFTSLCFLAAAVCMPDRSEMFAGLWNILKNPTKLTCNFFSVGGYAGTFLNMGLVAACCTLLYYVTGAAANSVSTLAFLLTLGFSSWGINVLNMWPTMLGVAVYALVRKEKLGVNTNAMLFSTGIAPFISELFVRYPSAEVIGFNGLGIVLGLVVGIVAGFFIPAGLPHSPKVHKGMDLYSAALPVGMTAFVLNGILYQVMGIKAPGAVGELTVANAAIVNIFCCALFGLCVVLALLLGCTPKDYWKLLKNPDQVTDFSATYGNATFLMNVGIYGLFIVAYYNIIGAPFNAVTLGVVFCMLCCCNSGSRPTNVWPIMAGYVVAAFAAKYASAALGGTFALTINAQAVVVGLCFANGLSPISDKYGWQYGIVSAMLHYCIVTLVPSLHGGFCLYNGGFTAVFVCILLVPILEKFCKTKEERRLAKAAK